MTRTISLIHSIHSLDHLTGDGSLCTPYYSITGCVPCDISGESCVNLQLLHPWMARPATWTFPLRLVAGAVTAMVTGKLRRYHQLGYIDHIYADDSREQRECRKSAEDRILRRVHERSTFNFRHRFSSSWTCKVLCRQCLQKQLSRTRHFSTCYRALV